MKMKQLCGVVVVGLGTAALAGQETNLNQQIELLQKRLQQTQETFEKALQEHQRTIEALKRQIEEIQKQSAASPPAGAATTAVAGAAKPQAGRVGWSPTDPIRLGKGSAYMDIGLVSTLAVGGSTARDIHGGTQLGGHDPSQNGFSLQGLEVNFAGAVDPYFRGAANLLFTVDSGGESRMELEEAWLETVSLPAKLQLRAGQIMTDFGRQNPTHPHTWGFVDTPLVLGRFFGHDGLRNLGARLSWLAPTPFYSELMLTVQNSHGETAFSFRCDHEGEPYLGRLHQVGRTKGAGELLFTPRYVASFDLTETQTLLLGASGAFGPNGSGRNVGTQIYGLDLYWKWKSKRHHGGFPFVSFQTEGLVRRYDAASFDWDLDGDGLLALGSDERDLDGDGLPDVLPRERLTDYGLYSQLSWGFAKGWVAALRGDWVAARQADYEKLYGYDLDRAARWRLSPSLTWYPSEFSKVRLQYNFDEREHVGPDHSIWLQLEFILGAHAAHKF